MKDAANAGLLPDSFPGMPNWMLRAAAAVLSPVLGVRECERLNREAASCPTLGEWARTILRSLEIEVSLSGFSLDAVVPPQGPLAVVGNHPYGILDAIAVAAVVSPLRSDLRYLGQSFLQRVPQARSVLFPLQPTTGKPFQRTNAHSLRRAIQWVQGGHAMAHFPAPAIACWNWSQRRVEDAGWSTLVGTLVRSSEACVAPLLIRGRNSLLFQAVGATYGPLRYALVLRELLNKRGTQIHITVGPRLQKSNFRSDASAAMITSQIRGVVQSLRG